MTKAFDAAVVGAGFAGLACGHAAAIRGLRTVVLDRRRYAGHRPHTTGLLVKEVADAWDVPRGMVRKIHGVRLYSPSLKSVDLYRAGYYFLATDVAWLMRWWARQAQLVGADVRYGVTVEAGTLRRVGTGWRVGDLEARYVIGADGPRSAVAAATGLGVNRRFLVGVEAEFEGVRGIAEDLLHVFIDPKLAPGYIAWAVPGVRVTQIGLAGRKGKPIALERFLERVSGVFDMSGAREVSRRGGLIPVGGPVDRMSRPGVMLVGDAAGWVSPLTAGGIHTALQSGRAAGLAVSDHLLDGGPDPARVVRRVMPTMGVKRAMRSAMDLPWPAWVYDAALSSPVLRATAQTVFFHHRGLLAPETWRDLWRNVVVGAR